MARTCPSDEVLQRWSDPSASDSFRSAIAAHVQQCESCRARLTSIVRSAVQEDSAAMASTVDAPAEVNDSTVIHAADKFAVDETPPVPKQIGNYEILRELARGGMGVVYQARQRGINRIVALKMILSGTMAGIGEIRRFVAEAEAAGKLDHPHIVPIFEVGEFDGRPYFSMGYVDGQSLGEVLRNGPLKSRPAARLMQLISHAVHYAHGKGIIHRDLKPGNVMIDRQGTPRVTDFGLAKQVSGTGEMTVSGDVLGTPSYMPPEQAEGRIDRIDARSDVYSLGAMLYCLVTGRPPFQAASLLDTLWQVIHVEPVPIRRLNPELPRDLETLCLKALQKDRGRRYQTAAELAEELGRFLRNEPIEARPVGRGERAWRWACRNPVLAVLGIVTFVSSMAGVSATLYYGSMANHRASEAETAREQSKKDASDAITARDAATKSRDEAKRLAAAESLAKSNAETQLARAESSRYAGLVMQAERDLRERDFDRAGRLLAETAAELRSWEYAWLSSQYASQIHREHWQITGVRDAAVSPDGQWIATVEHNLDGRPTQVRLWPSSGDGAAVFAAPLGNVGDSLAVVFSRDGRRIKVNYNYHGPATVGVWSVPDGRSLRPENVASMCLDPASEWLVTTSNDVTDGKRTWTLRNLADGRIPLQSQSLDSRLLPQAILEGGQSILCLQTGNPAALCMLDSDGFRERWSQPHKSGWLEQQTLAFSQDGRSISRIVSGNSFEIISAADGTIRGPFTKPPERQGYYVSRVVLSPDGTTAASVESFYGTVFETRIDDVILWDVATGKIRFVMQVPASAETFHFCSGGQECIAREANHGLLIRDVITGEVRREIQGDGLDPQSVTLSPSGRLAAVSYVPEAYQVFEIASGRRLWTLPQSGDFRKVGFSQAEDQLVASWVNRVAAWKLTPRSPRKWLEGHTGAVRDVSFLPDSQRFVTTAMDKTVRLWDGESGEQQSILDRDRKVDRAICVSPDGTKVASSQEGAGPTVQIWDLETGKTTVDLKSPPPTASQMLQFSPDGSRLASATGITLSLWETATGESIPTGTLPAGQARSIAFLNDRNIIGVGPLALGPATEDQCAVRILNIESGQLVGKLSGHLGLVGDLRLSSDGRWIATASGDQSAAIWDATTSKRVALLLGHGGTVCHVRWTADGKRLITAGADRSVRLWDAKSGLEVFRFNSEIQASNRYSSGNDFLGFDISPDSRRIVIGGDQGRLRIWSVPETDRRVQIEARAEEVVWSGDQAVFLTNREQLVKADAETGEVTNRVVGSKYIPRVPVVDRSGQLFHLSPSLWRWNGESNVDLLPLDDATDRVGYNTLAVSPDGTLVATAAMYDPAISLWAWKKRQRLTTLKRPGVDQVRLAFTGDGKGLLSVNTTRDVPGTPMVTSIAEVWDLDTGSSQVLLERPHERFTWGACHPYRRQCAIGSRELYTQEKSWLTEVYHGKLTLIDYDSDPPVSRELPLDDESNPHPDRNAASVIGCCYSADGRFLAATLQSQSVGRDGRARLRIYDLEQQAPIVTLRLSGTEAGPPAISPDGKRIAVPLGSQGVVIMRMPGH